MRHLYLLVFLLSLFQDILAQEPEDMLPSEPPRSVTMPGLYGKVVESQTNKGIDAASVQIFPAGQDSVSLSVADSLILGMLTKPNGDFRFTSTNLPDSFILKVTALGYTDNTQKVVLDRSLSNIRQGIDLGNIKLAATADLLGSVTVVATKPALQMGIDRKIFNVDKSITSTGGTAVDIMRNIPSVTVDVNGEVQLRNSSPQIFVDGRPTILTLDQIAADDIERIELITNPSAKFDAASAGGIINVVLKKNRRFGINGIASIGAGTPDILTGNLSLSYRQGKFNFFGSANYNQSGGVARSESDRENKSNGNITDFFSQESENDRERQFRSVRFGVDYFIDNRNTISISQNFVKGDFNNQEIQRQRYFNAAKSLTQTGQRISDNNSAFGRNRTQLYYTHTFPQEGKELSADITYSKGDRSGQELLTNFYFDPSGVQQGDPNLVRNDGDNNSEQVTAQIDFVNPINENSKLEMGLRTFHERTHNIYNAFSLNNNTEVKLPLSTNVLYDETVHAAYTTYTGKMLGLKYQAGLRAEYSLFEGNMVDSMQTFGYELPVDIGNVFDGLFPSLYLTKEVGEGKEMQVNFSRRIRRPRFWQLNPYIDINDPLNISRGNPTIRPEYVNAFELNYNQQYGKGNFLAVLYFHNNQDDITNYSDTISAALYEEMNNAAISPNAILNTFVNAQFTNRMGAEFTLNHKVGDFEFIPNINMQYRKVKAVVGDLNLNNQGFNWETKLIVNYTLTAKPAVLNRMNFQLTSNYESREVIPQGRNKAQFVTDFALRKEFMKKNAASLTLSINDVFNTNRWGQIYDTENFYQDSYRRWNVRNFRLTFSYRFGNRDFNLFGSQREGRRGGGGDGSDD